MHVGLKGNVHFKYSFRTGFTIVELLIVIVIIGILTTIATLAYTGISQNARVATLTSDLDSASRQLKLYQVDNATYPTSLDCSASPVANSICLKNSNGTTYITYTTDTTTIPQTFCLTATRNNTNYYINQDGTPQSGSCTTTNLIGNPSLTTNSNGWAISGSFAVTGRTFINGEWVYLATRNGSGSAVIQCNTGPCLAITTPGKTYTASATVTSSVNTDVTLRIRRGGGTVTLLTGPTVSLIAGVPQRISVSGLLSDSSVYVAAYSAAGNSGETLSMDKVFLAEGSTVYNYADGDSPGWSWSGTANASTSFGPPL